MTRRWLEPFDDIKGTYKRSFIHIKLKIYTFLPLALRYLKAYGQDHGQAYDMVEYTINMPVLHILSDITERNIDVLELCFAISGTLK